MTLRQSLTGGTAALLALLGAASTTVELGPAGWIVGLTCGVLVSLSLGWGLAVTGATALGPADAVTLARVTLACVVAAVVASRITDPVTQSTSSGPTRTTLVTLAVLALVLDAVDGRIARRTGTTSAFGARFDGEADAFLIMVLSLYVASSTGAWVLLIGAARYLFGAAGWILPWMRRELPPRYWRKVVAAVQGVMLTWAAADVAAPWVVATGVALALALLVESFGRDVVWLWSRRTWASSEAVEPVLLGAAAVVASGPRR